MASAVSAQIADALTIPIDTTDAIAELDWPVPVSDIRQDQLLAALGASLGAAAYDYGIPFVDVSQQEQVAQVRRRAPSLLLAGMAGSTVWMIAAAVGAIALAVLESNTSTHLNEVRAEIERIKAEQAPGIRYRDLMNSVLTIQRESQVPAMSVLGRVAASVTPGVSLTSVDVTGDGKVAVGGKAVGYGAVQTFAYALGQGKAVVLPYIESVKRDQGGVLTFRIVGTSRGVSEEPADKGEGGGRL
jgi:hypothetical protein